MERVRFCASKSGFPLPHSNLSYDRSNAVHLSQFFFFRVSAVSYVSLILSAFVPIFYACSSLG